MDENPEISLMFHVFQRFWRFFPIWIHMAILGDSWIARCPHSSLLQKSWLPPPRRVSNTSQHQLAQDLQSNRYLGAPCRGIPVDGAQAELTRHPNWINDSNGPLLFAPRLYSLYSPNLAMENHPLVRDLLYLVFCVEMKKSPFPGLDCERAEFTMFTKDRLGPTKSSAFATENWCSPLHLNLVNTH